MGAAGFRSWVVIRPGDSCMMHKTEKWRSVGLVVVVVDFDLYVNGTRGPRNQGKHQCRRDSVTLASTHWITRTEEKLTATLLLTASLKIYPARAPRAFHPAVSTPQKDAGKARGVMHPRSVHRDHFQVPRASMLLAGSAGVGAAGRYPLRGCYGRGRPAGWDELSDGQTES